VRSTGWVPCCAHAQVRLVLQAEQETLRVHQRVSRPLAGGGGGGWVLSACSLLDGLSGAAGQIPASSSEDTAEPLNGDSEDVKLCRMMRHIEDKFNRLKVRRHCQRHGR